MDLFVTAQRKPQFSKFGLVLKAENKAVFLWPWAVDILVIHGFIMIVILYSIQFLLAILAQHGKIFVLQNHCQENSGQRKREQNELYNKVVSEYNGTILSTKNITATCYSLWTLLPCVHGQLSASHPLSLPTLTLLWKPFIFTFIISMCIWKCFVTKLKHSRFFCLQKLTFWRYVVFTRQYCFCLCKTHITHKTWNISLCGVKTRIYGHLCVNFIKCACPVCLRYIWRFFNYYYEFYTYSIWVCQTLNEKVNPSIL